MLDKNTLREQLMARRQQVLLRWKNEMADETDLLDEREPDWEDHAAVVRDARVLERLGDADLRELGAIAAALRRLDDATYGLCEECGLEIPEKRLAVLPEASMCTSCAAAKEKPFG